MADSHGNILYLFERDAAFNVTKKVIEEAPSVLTPELRKKWGGCLAKSCDYLAGTVEFLLMKTIISFLEMNTRLQVEHPVTELITGLRSNYKSKWLVKH
jgi:acetyl/propionyl-CoA carboxylase alpha subunit